jgi:hypothetical protein
VKKQKQVDTPRMNGAKKQRAVAANENDLLAHL